MHYMLLLYISDRPQPGTPDAAEEFDKVRAFHRVCRERGALVASAPLLEPGAATTVRTRGGRTVKLDGPFAETKEWLGGYFILDCEHLEEALQLAALCPTAAVGSVEVRPLLELG
jgi:hypothetical protein